MRISQDILLCKGLTQAVLSIVRIAHGHILYINIALPHTCKSHNHHESRLQCLVVIPHELSVTGITQSVTTNFTLFTYLTNLNRFKLFDGVSQFLFQLQYQHIIIRCIRSTHIRTTRNPKRCGQHKSTSTQTRECFKPLTLTTGCYSTIEGKRLTVPLLSDQGRYGRLLTKQSNHCQQSNTIKNKALC